MAVNAKRCAGAGGWAETGWRRRCGVKAVEKSTGREVGRLVAQAGIEDLSDDPDVEPPVRGIGESVSA